MSLEVDRIRPSAFILYFYAQASREQVNEIDMNVSCTQIQQLRSKFREFCHASPKVELHELRKFLDECPGDEQADVLVDLVVEHLTESWRVGWGKLVLEDYVEEFGQQFDEFASSDVVPSDIVECEFISRHEFPETADHPSIDEYRQRFPDRPDIIEQLQSRCLDGERYIRLRRQGEGGLGRVWVAFDCHLCRYVAIKEPNTEVAADSRMLRRLANEARFTAGLDHPAIVAVHELREPRHYAPFYVMRLVEGQTLRKFIHDADGEHGRNRRVKQAEILRSFITVCEAIAYAHSHGVIHRDLKPDNIVLGKFGETIVLDWGLAKRVNDVGESDGPVTNKAISISFEQNSRDTPLYQKNTATTSIVGTPAYMSPEQAQGMADRRSDIFGLGAILYEILTGRPPYEAGNRDKKPLFDRVLAGDYKAPRRVNKQVSRPLEAVCLKALSRDPQDRYTDATKLADDVRRWLADEPVSVYRDGVFGRTARLIRRHVGAAIAASVAILAVVVGTSISKYYSVQAAQRSFDLKLQLLGQNVESNRSGGWTDNFAEQVRSAAETRHDSRLRDVYVQSFPGIDAQISDNLTRAAPSLTFDESGQRLLVSGIEAIGNEGEGEAATLWTIGSTNVAGSSPHISGPVAFEPDGKALLLFHEDRRLVLWNIEDGTKLREFSIPAEFEFKIERSEFQPVLAMSLRANFVAAAFKLTDDGQNEAAEAGILIWTREGEIVRIPHRATVLEFSPDGELLAAGNAKMIHVFSTATGNEAFSIPTGEQDVLSLAFGRCALSTAGDADSDVKANQWRLAAGHSGGAVSTWELAGSIPFRIWRKQAISYGVHGASFSPDGAVLATCGRGVTKLWDAVTGEHLLDIETGNTTSCVRFSPDGQRLAVGSVSAFSQPGEVKVFDLENGRGIRTLRGFSSAAQIAVFSPDNRWVAAVFHDWTVGVWDLTTGQLTRLFKVPPADFVDNSAVALSSNGRLLAFSSGKATTLWDVATGNLRTTWKLPPGLNDRLVFGSDGTLISFRLETKSMTKPPYSDNPAAQDPRVCRLRHRSVTPPFPTTTIEIDDFDRGVLCANTMDGSLFVVEGIHSEHGRRIGCYDGITGDVRWFRQSGMKRDFAELWVEPNGEFVVVRDHSRVEVPAVLDPTNGESRSEWPGFPSAISQHGEYLVTINDDGLGLMRNNEVLVTLASRVAPGEIQFSSDGRLILWMTNDGRVLVADIEQVRNQLNEFGLGWWSSKQHVAGGNG